MEHQVFIPAASLNDLYVSAIFITNTGEYRPDLKHQVLLLLLLLILILTLTLICSRQVFLLSIHCSRVQAVDLGRYRRRSYFSDSIFLSMWAVPSSLIFWISLVLMLAWILPVTLSSPFLIRPRAPTTTGIVSVFISHILLTSISKSLYLVNFSVNFAEVLLSDGTAMSMSKHLLSLPCENLLLVVVLVLES